MSIQKVMIAGAGLMGSGIAQVCAQSGYEVILNDVYEQALKKAMDSMHWSVGKFVEKGKLQEDSQTILNRVKTTQSLEEGSDADLMIEAVFEDFDLKKEMFQKADSICADKTLLATNTSSIPITELAAVTNRSERVMGLHFFSPVPMMQAVEVIRAITTQDHVIESGDNFVRSLNKEPIFVNKDVAGFVINRINFPSTIEAIRTVEQGIATCEDIDKGMKLASGRRMGVFEVGDMVGLDVTYGAMMSMYNETGDSRFYPPRLLRRKVKAGQLGRKTGKGWYEYDENGNRK